MGAAAGRGVGAASHASGGKGGNGANGATGVCSQMSARGVGAAAALGVGFCAKARSAVASRLQISVKFRELFMFLFL
jgi:hypothetical protein